MALEKLVRPQTTEGLCIHQEVGCGDLAVIVSKGSNGYLEIFARLGKAGGCSNCQNEALTVAITLGLRYGIPAEEYVQRLQGVKCPNPKMFPKEDRCLSCPDAIGKALEIFLKQEPKNILREVTKIPLIAQSKPARQESVSLQVVNRMGICPDCGSDLVFSEGCSTCSNPSCGWSKCS